MYSGTPYFDITLSINASPVSSDLACYMGTGMRQLVISYKIYK